MEPSHQVHNHVISNLDLSETHRLPTVSAADALAELENEQTMGLIPTGLPSLDRILAHVDLEDSENPMSGGLAKGQLTEAWGPPGAGKTALGIQLAVNALQAGGRVTWIDALHPMLPSRMEKVLAYTSSFSSPGQETTSQACWARVASRFAHFTCPSFAHFVALVCRSTHQSISSDTSLLVIDSLSALVNHSYPKGHEASKSGFMVYSSPTRRYQTLQYIIESLQKLAATRDMAILLLNQCATKLYFNHGAVLVPSLSTNLWEQGVATRFVLFKDWIWTDHQPTVVHFLGVQKVNGKIAPFSALVVFEIGQNGISEVPYDGSEAPVTISTPTRKRKAADAGLEIPDSEEEYSWGDEEDESLIPGTLIQGWLGSEDMLLNPTQHDSRDEDGSEGFACDV